MRAEEPRSLVILLLGFCVIMGLIFVALNRPDRPERSTHPDDVARVEEYNKKQALFIEKCDVTCSVLGCKVFGASRGGAGYGTTLPDYGKEWCGCQKNAAKFYILVPRDE